MVTPEVSSEAQPAASQLTSRVAYGHASRIFDVAFSPDDTRIVSASEDTTARVWCCQDASQAALLHGHSAEVMRAAWSPHGSLIATGVFH